MYNRLFKFLESHEILFDKQFGFRSKHNMDHAILSIVNKIQNSMLLRAENIHVEFFLISVRPLIQ